MSWILKELSEQGRSVAQYIARGVEENYSATKIIDIIREQGLGYRESEMRNDIRVMQGAAGAWKGMRYAPRDYVIRPEWYKPAYTKIEENYMTVIECDVYNNRTGETYTKHVAIKSDILKTRRELEEEAEKRVVISDPDQEVKGSRPVRAIRRS
jgi:hypothetical protein